MKLAEWNTGRKPAESERPNFEGMKKESAQAWDYAFCQIVGEVAHAAKLTIVKRRQGEDA